MNHQPAGVVIDSTNVQGYMRGMERNEKSAKLRLPLRRLCEGKHLLLHDCKVQGNLVHYQQAQQDTYHAYDFDASIDQANRCLQQDG